MRDINYVLPVDQTGWKIEGGSTTTFRWDYDKGGMPLLNL